MKSQINPDIQKALAALHLGRIRHAFFVACGGSLSIMYPGKYFLDRHSTAITSDVYNGDEFVTRDPLTLGPGTLVILCSQTGTTRETVRAAQHAKLKGAVTIGMTLDSDSPLAKVVDHCIAYQASYTTGVPIDAADSNYSVLYMILAGLIRQTDNIDIVPVLLSSLSNLQPAIDRAHVKLNSIFDAFSIQFKDAPVIYTLASGANYGASYSFAICVLMEMLWINSQAIHANEFFHGSFEVVDRDSKFICMVGLDETRRLEERARDFLLRFGAKENMLVLDAHELDLSGIDETFKGYLIPLIFFDTLWKFAYKLAAQRGKVMLEDRRYMKKINDY